MRADHEPAARGINIGRPTSPAPTSRAETRTHYLQMTLEFAESSDNEPSPVRRFDTWPDAPTTERPEHDKE